MAAITHEEDSSVKSSIAHIEDLSEESLVMVKHKEELKLHGHDEGYDFEISICTHSLLHVDHELLESHWRLKPWIWMRFCMDILSLPTP